jgi:arylsulfatase A-like enzyme
VQVDIAPTILDRLGLPIPASWEGQSLLHPSPQRFTHHQTYFLPNRFAVLYRDNDALFKYIATPQYGQEELYDLRNDAREQHNLVKEKPALNARLRERLSSDSSVQASSETVQEPAGRASEARDPRQDRRRNALTGSARP